MSANIHFAHPESIDSTPPKPSGSAAASVIRELGGDIGPRPRFLETLDKEEEDEIEMVGVDASLPDERSSRHGKGRALQHEQTFQDSSIGTDR